MSLLALLAAGAYPAPTGAVLAVRPTTFAETYDVGAGWEYATIGEALTAANADHNLWVGTASQQLVQTSPYHRRLIRVHPGTYAEGALSPLGHTAIVGTTGDPADVIVTWGGASNVLVATGRSLYVAHLTLDHTDPDPEWHPMRNAGSAGDIGMGPWQPRTGLFDNVVFRTAFEGEAGKSAVDTTPGGNCHLIYHRCWFDSPGQPQAINMSVNYPAPGLTSASWFIDCKVTSNYGWTEDPTLPNNGYTDGTHTTPNPPAPVGFPDKGNQQVGGVGRADTLVWVGGEWDIGDHITPIQGLIRIPNLDAGDNALFTIDPDLPEGIGGAVAVNIGNADNLTRAVPELDYPIADGISDYEVAFYGPDPADSDPVVTVAASAVGTSSVTVPANRVFWIPVELPEVMIRAGKVRVTTTSGGGNLATATALPAYGTPGAIEPDSAGRRASGVVAVAAGQQDVTLTARWYYPGYGRVWVGVAFSAETSVAGWSGSEVPGLDVLYTDGWTGAALDPAGATALAAGQPIPAVTIVNTA